MNLKKSVIGIELGSTRIKAVLLDEYRNVVAQGDFLWENKLVNGIWTYSMDDVDTGIKSCFRDLKKNFKNIIYTIFYIKSTILFIYSLFLSLINSFNS